MPETVVVEEVRDAAVAERLARLRDLALPRREFRTNLSEVARGLALAVGMLPPPAVVVPVLRAGLGMLEGALDVFADAEVGFVGLRRDEHTLAADCYFVQLPASLAGASVVVLDPMVATGGSLTQVVRLLHERGAGSVTALAAVVSPDAIARLRREALPLRLVCAAVDERLDARGFIVPGLGDAGDRLYGAR